MKKRKSITPWKPPNGRPKPTTVGSRQQAREVIFTEVDALMESRIVRLESEVTRCTIEDDCPCSGYEGDEDDQ